MRAREAYNFPRGFTVFPLAFFQLLQENASR